MVYDPVGKHLNYSRPTLTLLVQLDCLYIPPTCTCGKGWTSILIRIELVIGLFCNSVVGALYNVHTWVCFLALNSEYCCPQHTIFHKGPSLLASSHTCFNPPMSCKVSSWVGNWHYCIHHWLIVAKKCKLNQLQYVAPDLPISSSSF